MIRPDRRSLVESAPAVVCTLLAGLVYISYSVGQWNQMTVPSWDLGIFTELAKAYSRGEAPIAPIKGVGYNLLGDHFHPILVVLAPVYRLWPSGLSLLIVQDLLIAWSVWPITRLAVRVGGLVTGSGIGLAYAFAWGFQGAVAAQFHEVAFAVPLLAFASVAFVERRFRATMLWLAPLVLVKEDLGLTVMMAGLVLAWVRRNEDGPLVGAADSWRGALRDPMTVVRRIPQGTWTSLAFAAFGAIAFLVTVTVVLPALSPDGVWEYSLSRGAADEATATMRPLQEVLTHPTVKVATLLILACGAGIIGLGSPWMALVLPTLAWRYLGSMDAYWEWRHWHYNAVLVPIATGALLDVLRRLSAWRDRRNAERAAADQPGAAVVEPEARALEATRLHPMWAVVLGRVGGVLPLVTLIVTMQSLPMWQLTQEGFGDEPARMEAVDGAMAAVPQGAVVESDLTLLTYLVPDHIVYWVGSADGIEPEYIVVDTMSSTWGGNPPTAESWGEKAHEGADYETIYDVDGMQVARLVD